MSMLTMFWFSLNAAVSSSPPPLLLHHVRQVHVGEQKVTENANIAVIDGRIAAWPSAPPPGATVLDMNGMWLIPGLIDTHVHISANAMPDGNDIPMGPHPAARAQLYAGVVAILDLASDADVVFDARAAQRGRPREHDDEADLYCAGQPFGRWNLDDPNTAAATVLTYVRRHRPDVVKFVYNTPTLRREPFLAAMRALAGGNTPTVVHIGTWDHARDAVQAGATAVTHLWDDAVIPGDLPALWAAKRIWSIPTMAVQMEMADFADDPGLLRNDTLLADLLPGEAITRLGQQARFIEKARDAIDWQHDDRRNDEASLKALRAAGVRILAGSDTNNLGTVQGFSTHREIYLLVRSGLSPWEALEAATTRAAEFLRRPVGVRMGDVAEFLVLRGDPIADIRNTEKIALLVHHGRSVDRDALRRRVQRDWPQRKGAAASLRH